MITLEQQEEQDQVRTLLVELVGELEHRFPYAAALATKASGVNGDIDKHEQQMSATDPSQGIVYTVYNGEYLEELAVGGWEADEQATQVRQWAAGLPVSSKRRSEIDPGPTLNQHFDTPLTIDPRSMPVDRKRDHLVALQAQAQRLHRQILNAQVHYSDLQETKLFVNRTRRLSQTLVKTNVMLTLVAAAGGQPHYDWLLKAGLGGFEVVQFTGEELAGLGESVLAMLGAVRLERGLYDVVTDPSVSGVIAHECFGHGVELDMFVKGRARAAGCLQQIVAAPQVDMYDDPSVPGAYGSYFFDDEGVLAGPTQILRKGVLEYPLTDLFSAVCAGRTRTANGRRQSYANKCYARMSNTFFAAGDETPETLFMGVKHGVYLRRAESGMEDPKDWGIQVTAHFGEEIFNGKLTGRRFAPVGITGYVTELLQSIRAVGNDLALDGGMCGKGNKEYVRVASGGPHMQMRARLG